MPPARGRSRYLDGWIETEAIQVFDDKVELLINHHWALFCLLTYLGFIT